MRDVFVCHVTLEVKSGPRLTRRPSRRTPANHSKYSEHIYFGFGWWVALTSSIIARYTATKTEDKKFHCERAGPRSRSILLVSFFFCLHAATRLRSNGARNGAQEEASWSCFGPRLIPSLSWKTCSVQTSTKIVEETSKNLPQTKGRRCQDRWRDWRQSVRCQFVMVSSFNRWRGEENCVFLFGGAIAEGGASVRWVADK